MMAFACGFSVLIVVAIGLGLLALTKRAEPAGCMIFFGFLFFFCLAGLNVPQLIFKL